MSRTAWQDRHAVPVHHHLHSNIRPTHHRHFHHKGPRELPVVTGRQPPNKRYELGADGKPTEELDDAMDDESQDHEDDVMQTDTTAAAAVTTGKQVVKLPSRSRKA